MKLISLTFLVTVQAIPALILTDTLHDIGILYMDKKTDYEKRVAIYDQFVAIGLWRILACIDDAILNNLISDLKLERMFFRSKE